jgi:hypothetical protein
MAHHQRNAWSRQMTATLIREVEVLHPAAFNAGPRITKQQFITFGAKQYRVDIWTDSTGRVVRVADPVEQ